MSATAARSISQHVVDTLIGDKGLEHDCALLVVVRDSRDHQMASVLVPPHTIAVRGARRWARAQLESWGVCEEILTAAVMGISELVTNVVQHAGTSARVTMELADQLLVTVEDTGTWSAPRTGREDPPPRRAGGLLSWRPSPMPWATPGGSTGRQCGSRSRWTAIARKSCSGDTAPSILL